MKAIRTLTIGGMIALAGCPAAPPRKHAAPVILERPGEPWGEDLAGDVKAYLEQLHREKLHRAWLEDVVRRAAHWLPADDPANDLSRSVEVEVALDPRGQPTKVTLVTSSGHAPFDESALRAMRSIAPYPPLPASLAEQHVSLRWRLHRDGRLCDPRHARVTATPMRPADALRAALESGRLSRALEIVREHGVGPGAAELAVPLAASGLASDDAAARKLAVQLAARPTLERLLWETRDRTIWDAALGRLTAQKAGAPLAATLAAAGVPAGAEARRRVLALLKSLHDTGHAVPTETLVPLLSAKDSSLVIAAADLTSRADPLRTAMKMHRGDALVLGPLAVRLRRAIGPDVELEATIRSALRGPGAAETLRALCRHSIPELAGAVVDALKTAMENDVRIAALEALVCLDAGLGQLYAALKTSETPVKLAAIACLARARAAKRAVSYRLADVAYREKGAARAAALAALARLADPYFAKRVLAMVGRLSQKEKVEVAPALASYGDEAVPALTKLSQGAGAELVAAVSSALKAVGTAKAQEALGALPVASAPATAPAEVSLEMLLREACSSMARDEPH